MTILDLRPLLERRAEEARIAHQKAVARARSTDYRRLETADQMLRLMKASAEALEMALAVKDMRNLDRIMGVLPSAVLGHGLQYMTTEPQKEGV